MKLNDKWFYTFYNEGLYFLAHLGYFPMSLCNHDSWIKNAWRLCMLLLARVLIFQTSYFADISHNAPG